MGGGQAADRQREVAEQPVVAVEVEAVEPVVDEADGVGLGELGRPFDRGQFRVGATATPRLPALGVRGDDGLPPVPVVRVEPFRRPGAGDRTSSSLPKNSMNAALSSRICLQPCSTFSGLRKTSSGAVVASWSATCATCAASDLGKAVMYPETSHAPGTGPTGTRRAQTNPPLGSGRKAAGPMVEYVRYSRSSTRFSKTTAAWSLPRSSKTPSTGSRQPRTISRSAALRSGLLARN